MDKETIINLLQDFKSGKYCSEEIVEKLKILPFEDTGFAKVDHHRNLRNGYSETIFCKGKTDEQIINIFKSLEKNNNNVLLTFADNNIFIKLKKINSKVQFNEQAKLIYFEKVKQEKSGKILVLSAGTSDIPVAEQAAITAELMGSNVERVYDVGVAGLHRLLAQKEKIFNAKCIVVVAGMDGALPSVVGGLASCPVIAVPTSIGYGTNLGGIAPLLTMLNSCSPNISVVNIDNGFGAGTIASLINKSGSNIELIITEKNKVKVRKILKSQQLKSI